MAFFINLREAEGNACKVDPHSEARENEKGTQIKHARLDVPVQYQKWFDFEGLHGRTGQSSQTMLQKAVREFSTRRARDYYEVTKGNVGFICALLLKWARKHPEATWEVITCH